MDHDGIPLARIRPDKLRLIDRDGLERDIEKAERDLGIADRNKIEGDYFDHPDCRIPINHGEAE